MEYPARPDVKLDHQNTAQKDNILMPYKMLFSATLDCSNTETDKNAIIMDDTTYPTSTTVAGNKLLVPLLKLAFIY